MIPNEEQYARRTIDTNHYCWLFPVPDWLNALPSEQARLDATRVVFALQRQAGIDLPTDGELYRFDINHLDTNGMIDYFVRPMSGVCSVVGRSGHEVFQRENHLQFRRKAAGVVEGPLGEGGLNCSPTVGMPLIWRVMALSSLR